MRVLYITGACLFNNTSANMSHNAYVQGLIENGAQLDIIMASDSWGEMDKKFGKFDGARYYIYNSVSIVDRIRIAGRKLIKIPINSSSASKSRKDETVSGSIIGKRNLKSDIRSFAKRLFYGIFKQDPLYPLHHTWLRTASGFKGKGEYDLIVSNSSPAVSHRLVADLLDKKRIVGNRWIQIWEDPWYYDLYGQKSDIILAEEHVLLRKAQEVLYVSPLTLEYQKKHFPDCAFKMGVIPLPAFSLYDKQADEPKELSFGYFGDYYSHVRNLKPFYDALCKSGYKGFIYGDSEKALPSTDKVIVSGRVTLDVLEKVQNQTSILVHLCNLRGGQIPGKIYHYSATTKPILFILDGTEDEKLQLRIYFEQFNRYYFCDNTVEAILSAFNLVVKDVGKHFSPVESFSPKAVVKNFM